MPTIKVTLDTSDFDAGITRVKSQLGTLGTSAQQAGQNLKIDQKGLRDTTANLNATTAAAGGAAAGLGKIKTAVAGLGIATAFRSAITLLGGFDEKIRLVGQVAGATGREFDALRQKATSLGETTRFTGTQAAEGLQALAQAGLSAREAIAAIDATLNLAIAGQLELARSTQITVSTMAQFSIEAENAGRVVDVLTKASQSTLANVDQLAVGLRQSGAVASDFGISLETTVAALGLLVSSGLRAEQAGTGLRNVLLRLESGTTEVTKALEAVGLSVDDVEVSTRGLIPVLETLGDANLSNAQKVKLFGVEGVTAFNALVKQIPSIQGLSDALDEAGGSAAATAAALDESLLGAVFRATSAFQGFIQAIGDAGLTAVLKSVITAAAGTFTDLTAAVNQSADAVRALIRLFTGDFSVITNAVTAVINKFISWRDVIVDLGARLKASIFGASTEVDKITSSTAKLEGATISAKRRADELFGGVGDDSLAGAAGVDTLTSAIGGIETATAKATVSTGSLTTAIKGMSSSSKEGATVAAIGMADLEAKVSAATASTEALATKMREDLVAATTTGVTNITALFGQAFTDIGAGGQQLFENLDRLAQGLGVQLGATFAGISETIGNALGLAANEVNGTLSLLGKSLGAFGVTLQDVFGTQAAAAIQFFGTLTKNEIDAIVAAGSKLLDFFGFLFPSATATATAAHTAHSTSVVASTTSTTGILTTLWGGFQTFFGGIVSGITTLWTNWTTTSTAASTAGVAAKAGLWQQFLGFFQGIGSSLLSIWNSWTTTSTATTASGTAAKAGLWAQFQGFFLGVVGNLQAVWSGLTAFLTANFGGSTGAMTALFGAFAAFFGSQTGSMSGVFSSFSGAMVSAFNSAIGAMRSAFSAFGSFFNGLVGGLASSFGSFISGAISGLNGLVGAASSAASGISSSIGGAVSGAIGAAQAAASTIGGLLGFQGGGVIGTGPGGTGPTRQFDPQNATVAFGGQQFGVASQTFGGQVGGVLGRFVGGNFGSAFGAGVGGVVGGLFGPAGIAAGAALGAVIGRIAGGALGRFTGTVAGSGGPSFVGSPGGGGLGQEGLGSGISGGSFGGERTSSPGGIGGFQTGGSIVRSRSFFRVLDSANKPGVGQVGEAAAPEAILPLERNSRGRLGVIAKVDASGVGGKGGPTTSNTFIIDARGADQDAIQRLERLIREVNGSVEYRAAATFEQIVRRAS